MDDVDTELKSEGYSLPSATRNLKEAGGKLIMPLTFPDFLSVLPSLFFHVFGPLTLLPSTKSAAADELEKRISLVVPNQ